MKRKGLFLSVCLILSVCLCGCESKQQSNSYDKQSTSIQNENIEKLGSITMDYEKEAAYVKGVVYDNALSEFNGRCVHKIYFDKNANIESADISSEEMGMTGNFYSCLQGFPNLEEIIIDSENTHIFISDNFLMSTDADNKRTGIIGCRLKFEGEACIPEETNFIGRAVFNKCKQISSIKIPEKVDSICDASFANMDSCTEIAVDKNNKNFKSVDGVLYTKDGKDLIAYPAGKNQKIFKVPENVERIMPGAFMGAVNLEKVILPSKCKIIFYKAFADCKKLKTVVKAGSNKVKGVAKNAYDGCKKLENKPKRNNGDV